MKQRHIKRASLEFDELIAAEAIKSVGLSLVSIFIPVYLLKLGFSVTEVIGFFLVQQAVYFVLIAPAGRLTLFLRPKRTVCLSYFLTLLALIVLSSLEHNKGLLLVPAVIAGAAECLYWISYHTNLSRLVRKGRAGREITLLAAAMKVIGVFGPMIGGFIAYLFGGEKLFLVAAILLAAAALPLLFTSDTVRQKQPHYGRLKPGAIASDLAASAGSGINGLVATAIWPLFLVTVLSTYAEIGLLVSASTLAGFLVLFAVGRLTDKGALGPLLWLGAFLYAGTNLLRLTGVSPFVASAATVGHSVADSVTATPLTAAYYRNASLGHRVEYIVRMEQGAFVARVSVLALLFGVSLLLPPLQVFALSFAIAAAAALLIPLMKLRG